MITAREVAEKLAGDAEGVAQLLLPEGKFIKSMDRREIVRLFVTKFDFHVTLN